jgi:hypothetical protein
MGPLMAPLHITADGFDSLPKVYLGSRADRVLPWRFQMKMNKAARAQLVEPSGGRSPFQSVADQIVARLLEVDVEGN